MSDTTEKPTVNFMLMTIEEHPNKFLMVRQVGEYATHYMDPTGVWVAWPEDDLELQETFEYLKVSGALPEFDVEGMTYLSEKEGDELDRHIVEDLDGVENPEVGE